MPDLLFQNLSTVQNDLMPVPVTIASGATLTPTTFITVVTGTSAVVANITPPVTGSHMLCFVPTAALPVFLTSGNIANAGAISTPNVPFFAIYNPLTAKYHIAGKA